MLPAGGGAQRQLAQDAQPQEAHAPQGGGHQGADVSPSQRDPVAAAVGVSGVSTEGAWSVSTGWAWSVSTEGAWSMSTGWV